MTEVAMDKLFAPLVTAFTSIPFNRMLGLQLQTLGPKEVVMRFEMKEEFVGNFLYGILHGGVISSVLDMAGGMVVMACALQKHADKTPAELATLLSKCSTVDLQISYLRPGQGEYFLAKAYLIKVGNKIAFSRMELFNHQDILIATGNGTYLV